MSFLIDTNTCSAFLKPRQQPFHRFFQHAGNLSISTVALAELYAWAYRRPDPRRLLSLIEKDLLPECRLIDFDSACARRFGQLRGELAPAGIGAESADLMIAAVALQHDLTLVTNNTKHFQPVPGLRVEDWLS